MFARKTIRECVVRVPLLARWPASLRSCCAMVVVATGLLGLGNSSSHAAGFGVRSPIPAYGIDYHRHPGFRHGGYYRGYHGWYGPYRYPYYYDAFPGYLDYYPSPFGDYPW
jgi:hypothetical protein